MNDKDTMMNETSGVGANVCKCPHHMFTGGLLLIFGLLFLAGNLGWVGSNVVDLGWPIIVILGGIAKLGEGKCKCC